MNAVGRGDVPEGETEDPLAQLKAEAQEARETRAAQKAQRLSKDEIALLESGMNARGDISSSSIEVAVAAPAEIARLEEEANLKVFQKSREDDTGNSKKKPWWKFGF